MGTTSARAESWIEINRSPHSTVYVDKGSEESSNGHVRYWQKHVFDAPHPIGVYDSQAPTGPNLKGVTKFVEMRYYFDVDCKTLTITSTLQKFYDADGNVVSTMTAVVGPNLMGANSIVLVGAKLMCQHL